MFDTIKSWFSIIPISSELEEKFTKFNITENIQEINDIKKDCIILYCTWDEI